MSLYSKPSGRRMGADRSNLPRGRTGPGAPPPFTYTPLRKNTQQMGPTPTGSSGISSFSARSSQRDAEDRMLNRSSLPSAGGVPPSDAAEGKDAPAMNSSTVIPVISTVIASTGHQSGNYGRPGVTSEEKTVAAGKVGEGSRKVDVAPLFAAPASRFVYAKPPVAQNASGGKDLSKSGTGNGPAPRSVPPLHPGSSLTRSESTSSAAALFGLAEDDEELQELFAELDAPSQPTARAPTVSRTLSEPVVSSSTAKPVSKPPVARRGLRPAKFDRRVDSSGAGGCVAKESADVAVGPSGLVVGEIGGKAPARSSDSVEKELRELREAAKTKESQVRLLRDQVKLKDASEVSLRKQLLDQRKELERIGAEAGQAAEKAMEHLSTQLEFKDAELRDIVAKQDALVSQLDEEKQRSVQLKAKVEEAEKAKATFGREDQRTRKSLSRSSSRASVEGSAEKCLTVSAWAVPRHRVGGTQRDIVMQIMRKSEEGLFALLHCLGHQPGATAGSSILSGRERGVKARDGRGLDPRASSEQLARVIGAVSSESAPCHALLPIMETLILEDEPVSVRHAVQVVQVLVEGCPDCRATLLASSLRDAPVELVPPTQASASVKMGSSMPLQSEELLPHPSFENSRILSAFAIGDYERDGSKKLLGKRRALTDLETRKRVFPHMPAEVYILPNLLASLPSYIQQEHTLLGVLSIFRSLAWDCPVSCLPSTFGGIIFEGKLATVLAGGSVLSQLTAVELLFRLAHSRKIFASLFQPVREIGTGRTSTIDLVVAVLKPEEDDCNTKRGDGLVGVRELLWQKAVSLLSLVVSMSQNEEQVVLKTSNAAKHLTMLLNHLTLPSDVPLEGKRLQLVKDVVQLLALLYSYPRCNLKALRHLLLRALTRLVKDPSMPTALKQRATKLLRDAAKYRRL